MRSTTHGFAKHIAGVCIFLGTAIAPARSLQAAPIQQNAAQQQQIRLLLQRINQLQAQSTDLTIRIEDLSNRSRSPAVLPSAPNKQPVSPPAPSTAFVAAQQAATDAARDRDNLKQQILTPLHLTAQYKQAADTLAAHRADLDRIRVLGAGPTPAVTALANQILADETFLDRLDQQALDQSPQWKTADAKVQAATRSLAALRAASASTTSANGALPPAAPAPVNPQEIAAQIRQLTTQRSNIDMQVQPLLLELVRLSPRDEQLAVQQGFAMREQVQQIRRQQVAVRALAGPPPVGAWPPGAPPAPVFPPAVPNPQQIQQSNDDAAKQREQQEQEDQERRQRQAQQDEDDARRAADLAQQQQQAQDEQDRRQRQQQQDEEDARRAADLAQQQQQQQQADEDNRRRQQQEADEQQQQQQEAAERQQEQEAQDRARQQQQQQAEEEQRRNEDARRQDEETRRRQDEEERQRQSQRP